MPARKIMMPAAVLAAAGTLAAGCGSTVSSSPAAVSGTERFTGSLSGKAAMASVTVFPLSWAGPVTAKGTFSPGSTAPAKGQHHVFKTDAGNLDAVITAVPESGATPEIMNPASCLAMDTTVVDFKADGAASTGRFHGAAGNDGKVTVIFQARLPKLTDGKCDMSESAQPMSATASFTGIVSLKLKSS